ncbi:hypothetical protein QQF64_019885 [Cirrhinus molitorella]|uniref:Ig-like domain-containing protein n=1 Tax=Cirrhinus molitorella TaxID=172907 RepID=A0ABR3LK44_9TELE
MKIVLTVLIPLFAIGVFIDGKETSNVELESVMEGDSVTLKSGVTHLQTDDEIEWRFNGNRIAKIKRDSIKISAPETFGDRLNLDNQTGDLKISNIKKTDSGQYKLKVSTTRGSPEMTFTVNVLPAGAVMKVTLMKGDLVTLLADPTDMQGCDVIKWRFRHQNSLVAEIDRKTGIISTSDGRFRDGLQLDNQTGSLTIKNIGTNHSGIYEVDISSNISSYTIHRIQSFNVTVMAHVKPVSVMEGDSVTLHTGLTEVQTEDQILWKFGDEVIARLNNRCSNKWNNICLKPQTGDLNISSIRRIQHGDYKVEINTRRMILNRTYNMNITDAVKPLSVKEGDPVTLQAVIEIQNDDLIQWMFENTLIAEIDKASKKKKTYDDQVERFRDRLNIQTGSLIITNTKTADSGPYELKIHNNRYTINQTISVTVTGSDDHKGSGLSPGAAAPIAVVVVGILAAVVVAAVVIYFCRKISTLQRCMAENGQNHKKQDTDDPNENAKLANNPETENSSSL